MQEKLKYGVSAVAEALHSIIHGAWRSKQAPADFKLDILIHIFKKAGAVQCKD